MKEISKIKKVNKKVIHSSFDPLIINAVMLFMTCFINYMARNNISVNILAMVNPKDNETAPDYGPRYDWDADAQAHILGAYFYGYLTTSLLGGTLSEFYGGRIIIFIFAILSALLTGISPILANDIFWYMFAIRFLIGVVGGVSYPALHNLVSRWSPPAEKGKFVASLLGGGIGTVVTWSTMGYTIEHLGWVWAFYLPAIFIAIVAGFWWYLVHDNPSTHPRISEKERKYIEDSLGDTISKSKEKHFMPVTAIALSIPFWSLLILHFGNLWGLYFITTASPNYIKNVLGFNIGNTGILASLPNLARVVFGVMFGQAGDYLRRKEILRVTTIRKSFTLFSHIIPGIFLISMGFIDSPYWSVAFLTFSQGFNGASTMTCLQNSQDLAPNFAGSLYGIINFVGSTTGFITPLVVSHFTKEENTAEQWRKIFYIGAALYIGAAVLFIFFGSGEIQEWNEPKTKKVNSKEESLDEVATNKQENLP